jgi:hypothetical protein
MNVMVSNTCQFSPDRRYRYTLSRSINGNEGPECAFIGLNPSTADETQLDPTLRRCIRFAKDWGYETFTMLNLFAYRSTDPNALYWKWLEPVGKDNNHHIVQVAERASLVVCAWGSRGILLDRGVEVKRLLQVYYGVKLHYLTLNYNGQPGHPLYLKNNLKPLEF